MGVLRAQPGLWAGAAGPQPGLAGRAPSGPQPGLGGSGTG